MSSQQILTAIDIGTDKCVTLIGSVGENATEPQIVGVGVVPSRGMKKSQIIDLEQVLATLSKSVEIAEKMAGAEVKQAFVSISGTHIHSQNSKGVVAVANPEGEVVPPDVARVIEAARAISLPSDREILHVIPKHFTVDSQEGIRDPVGMTGIRLESEAHIITGLSTYIRNIEKCILDLGIQVQDFVFSGLSAAEVVVSETEKELGVAVIDIGAGTTSICVYVDGALEYSGALPVGARHISLDIAHGCRVSFDVAEKIKLSLDDKSPENLVEYPGESKQDFNRRKKQADQIKLQDITGAQTQETVSRKMVIERIMLPRLTEITDLVKKELAEQGLLRKIRAGVVLTGGGSLTSNIAAVFKKELKTSARVGKPTELGGLSNDIMLPSFAASIGLLFYGLDRQAMTQSGKGIDIAKFTSGFSAGGVGQTVRKFFQSLLP